MHTKRIPTKSSIATKIKLVSSSNCLQNKATVKVTSSSINSNYQRTNHRISACQSAVLHDVIHYLRYVHQKKPFVPNGPEDFTDQKKIIPRIYPSIGKSDQLAILGRSTW
ncbi:hypothetical protein ACTXT7_015164 [Hymenolepis weldensis]